ncbi:sigma factor-like helix-turn-helix DNA-binding protein [Mycobacterium alsense]|uniref:helix-turn-helix domain-containing protein n=1 Tax=Mycobacterium alsense TaxID=324058 RepID=UPI0009EE2324
MEARKYIGLNQSEIAEMYGITRQYVSWIKHTCGGRLTPRGEVMKKSPFNSQDGQRTRMR